MQDITLDKHTAKSLKRYGAYVVEQRAIPDFRDGLKPVHRAILWAMHGLNLTYDKGYKKAARTVGETIGKYHAHGDTSTYESLVTLANTFPPYALGQGNWGKPDASAAAMRYTEAKLSKFSQMFLLDPKYLKVVPYVPNYSNDERIPLYLPALLPNLLLNGQIPVPAYGVSVGNPTFELEGLARIAVAMLKGQEPTLAMFSKNLKVKHPWGCNVVKVELENLVTTGVGRVIYEPVVDVKSSEIWIKSYCPFTVSSTEAIDKTLAKISEIDGVRRAYANCGLQNKDAGYYGAFFTVETDKGEANNLVEKVLKAVRSPIKYRLGVTRRNNDDGITFDTMSICDMLYDWVDYRVALEVDYLNLRLGEVGEELERQQVYLYAIENLKAVLAALNVALVDPDPKATLAKVLRISETRAAIILDRKVIQLARLEAQTLRQKIDALQAQHDALTNDLSEPHMSAARDTVNRVKDYLKSPDKVLSGLTF